jgi:hypothetical protein
LYTITHLSLDKIKLSLNPKTNACSCLFQPASNPQRESETFEIVKTQQIIDDGQHQSEGPYQAPFEEIKPGGEAPSRIRA